MIDTGRVISWKSPLSVEKNKEKCVLSLLVTIPEKHNTEKGLHYNSLDGNDNCNRT